MPSLSDIDTILLSTAATRASGSLLPTPTTLTATDARIAKAIASLMKRSLAEERDASESATITRTDGDLAFGAFITGAGYAAIGVEQPGEPDVAPPADIIITRAPTKTSAVVALLQREQGATLPELIAATGWLPHTTRAALTGLRKKGHAIERAKRDDATCYRITGTAA